jgi:hypothetical protein
VTSPATSPSTQANLNAASPERPRSYTQPRSIHAVGLARARRCRPGRSGRPSARRPGFLVRPQARPSGVACHAASSTSALRMDR